MLIAKLLSKNYFVDGPGLKNWYIQLSRWMPYEGSLDHCRAFHFITPKSALNNIRYSKNSTLAVVELLALVQLSFCLTSKEIEPDDATCFR